MNRETTLTRSSLKTPRTAAIAGILFPMLPITSLVLVRVSVPANLLDAGNGLGHKKSFHLKYDRFLFKLQQRAHFLDIYTNARRTN